MRMGKAGMFAMVAMFFASMGASVRMMGHTTRGPSSVSTGSFTGDFRKAHLKRIKYARARG